MKLNFRQGLVGYQTSAALQQFLIQSATPGFIDLIVSPTPTVVTFAHGKSNYLLKIDATIPQAWGPVTPGINNYLFWDINLLTGQVTRQITTLAPAVGPTPPANPVEGQMWFDTANTKMMVKRAGDKPWIECVRVFAGVASMGSTTAIELYGSYGAGISQVGLNVVSDHGFVLLDELGMPLKNSSGEFLTSMSAVRVRSGSNQAGVLTSPVNNLVQVVATEPIPEFSIVHFAGLDAIAVARQSAANPPVPVGIVINDLGTGEVGTMVQFGEITSDEWNWTAADAGKPLYVSSTGQVTTTRPPNALVHRVGFVKGPRSILFAIDSEAEAQVVSVPGSIIEGAAPIVAVTAPNTMSEIVTTISLPAATNTTPGHMTAAQVTTLNSFDERITEAEAVIDDLQATKAPITHGHSVADVAGLQVALNGKADINHNHDTLYAPVGHNHDAQYAPTAHQHFISDVTNLQTQLNSKAPLSHSHLITEVFGLQADLDTRALINHSHSIGEVSGLTAALSDSRSSASKSPDPRQLEALIQHQRDTLILDQLTR